jgi:hypothetical protein
MEDLRLRKFTKLERWLPTNYLQQFTDLINSRARFTRILTAIHS